MSSYSDSVKQRWMGGTKTSVRLRPAMAGAGFRDQRDTQAGGRFHRLADQIGGFSSFRLRHLQHQFVVDLEQHAPLKSGIGKGRRDTDHGALDDIGGRSLDQGVNRLPLGELAAGGVLSAMPWMWQRRPNRVVT